MKESGQMHNHSRIVAVILAHERRQFEIGDAILEELGPPQVEYHDGSYERLGEIVAELAEHGVHYDVAYLNRMRKVSHEFPAAARRNELSWYCHLEAGNPAMLERILREIGKAKPTTRLIKATRLAIETIEPLITEMGEAVCKLREAMDKLNAAFAPETEIACDWQNAEFIKQFRTRVELLLAAEPLWDKVDAVRDKLKAALRTVDTPSPQPVKAADAVPVIVIEKPASPWTVRRR
jgi:hypothetical protein